MVKLSILCLCVLVLHCARGSTIPKFLKTCKRADPKIGACVKQTVENLKPALIRGIPEMHVPPLDPFKMASLAIFDGTQIPNLTATLANLEITGLSNFDITKVKLDVDKIIYRVGVKLPFIEIHSDYDVDAALMGQKIKSTGNIRANATGIVTNAVLTGAVDDRNRLRIDSIALKITVDDIGLNLDNVLNENPALKQTIRMFLNGANKQDLIQVGLPYVETKCADLLLQLTNDVLTDLTYDDIFPV